MARGSGSCSYSAQCLPACTGGATQFPDSEKSIGQTFREDAEEMAEAIEFQHPRKCYIEILGTF